MSLASPRVPSPAGTRQGGQGSQSTTVVLKGSLEANRAREVAASGMDGPWQGSGEEICSLS